MKCCCQGLGAASASFVAGYLAGSVLCAEDGRGTDFGKAGRPEQTGFGE